MAQARKVHDVERVAHPATELAGFAAALSFEDIPRAVLERAKLLILDSLGVGLASNAE